MDRGAAQAGEDVPAYLAYLTNHLGDRHLVADITPAYAVLPVQRLAQMARMAPDVRFVYLMRDPVSRMWSHIRMLAERATRDGGDTATVAREMLDSILDGTDSGAVNRGDYRAALTRLWAAVDPSRLLAMFLEDMLTPAGYARLCSFLGIAPGQPDFDRRVFASAPVEMTGAQKLRIRAFLAPQYEFVGQHFGTLPRAWQKSLDEVGG